MTTATPTIAPRVHPAAPETKTGLQEPGEWDRFAHYACKAAVTEAYVFGTAVEALCGKYWVPTRDPDRYPICPACAERKAQGMTLDCS